MKRGKRDLSTILEERLLEFRDLLASGAAFSALTRLGEIQLTLPTLGSADRARWDGILSEVALPQALLSGNSSDMEANLERLRRISESDGDLQFEEVCLVLSLRWKVKCAVAYLERYGQSLDGNPLAIADTYVLALADDHEIRSKLGNAARFVMKNLGLPLDASELLPAAWSH